MIGVGSVLISLFLVLVCYSLTLTAKRADENLLMICEQNQKIEEEKGNQKRKCASCICGFGVFRGMLSFGR